MAFGSIVLTITLLVCIVLLVLVGFSVAVFIFANISPREIVSTMDNVVRLTEVLLQSNLTAVSADVQLVTGIIQRSNVTEMSALLQLLAREGSQVYSAVNNATNNGAIGYLKEEVGTLFKIARKLLFNEFSICKEAHIVSWRENCASFNDTNL